MSSSIMKCPARANRFYVPMFFWGVLLQRYLSPSSFSATQRIGGHSSNLAEGFVAGLWKGKHLQPNDFDSNNSIQILQPSFWVLKLGPSSPCPVDRTNALGCPMGSPIWKPARHQRFKSCARSSKLRRSWSMGWNRGSRTNSNMAFIWLCMMIVEVIDWNCETWALGN